MPASPDVPTMTAQGYRFDTDGWFALVAPKNTPPAVVSVLNREVADALAAPELKARLLQLNLPTHCARRPSSLRKPCVTT